MNDFVIVNGNAILGRIKFVFYLCRRTANQNAPATSAMDELRKLKELLDMGIVTQEEFDAKKKQLLGL